MKIQLIDFGGRSPESAHANDAGADVFSPKDAVIRREISVSCLWDLDASPDTGFILRFTTNKATINASILRIRLM